jgi:hypothetical protein
MYGTDTPAYHYRGEPSPVKKDYSMNSAGGDFAPARRTSAPSPPAATRSTVADDSSFAWGDAAAGAGVALLVTGGALGGRALIRRRDTLARVSP